MSKAAVKTESKTKPGADGAGGDGKAKVAPKGKADAGGGDGGAGDDGKKKKPGADGGDGDDKKKKPGAAAAAGADDSGGGGGDDDPGDGDNGGGGDDDDNEGGGENGGAGGDDDWRARMAGGDDAVLARLQRFTSEADVGRSLIAAEKLARQKGGIQLPPADAKPEVKAAFYTEHFGRPENVGDITLSPTVPDGEELTAGEVNLLQTVTGNLHQAGIFGIEQIHAASQLVTDMIVGGRQEQAKLVKDGRDASRKALEKVWGKGQVDANLEYANSYAAMRCEQAGVDPKALAEIKLQDGSLLGDNPLWAQVMAFGGRDHSEDPGMIRDDVGGGAGDLQAQLKTEMAKMNSKDPKERKFYSSAEGRELRNRLRSAIKRGGGGGKTAAKK